MPLRSHRYRQPDPLALPVFRLPDLGLGLLTMYGDPEPECSHSFRPGFRISVTVIQSPMPRVARPGDQPYRGM